MVPFTTLNRDRNANKLRRISARWFWNVKCSAPTPPSASRATSFRSFDPLRRLAPSYPARAPDSGVDYRVRLSMTIAVGWVFTRAATRLIVS